MEPNEEMREHIFDTIDNQIKNNDPPETKITYDRLRSQGYDDFVTKHYIGQCLALEIYDILKHQKTFDLPRYIKNLLALPKEPFDDEN